MMVRLEAVLVTLGFMASFVFPLVHPTRLLHEACDFVFEGHQSYPPLLSLAPSSTYPASLLSSRSGKRVKAVGGVSGCTLFPGKSDPHVASKCASYFMFTAKKNELATTPSMLSTGLLRGTGVVLHLSSLQLDDGTLLTPGDGNTQSDETRRCVVFFTLPDMTTARKGILGRLEPFQQQRPSAKIIGPIDMKDDRHEANKRAHHTLRQIGKAFVGQELP